MLRSELQSDMKAFLASQAQQNPRLRNLQKRRQDPVVSIVDPQRGAGGGSPGYAARAAVVPPWGTVGDKEQDHNARSHAGQMDRQPEPPQRKDEQQRPSWLRYIARVMHCTFFVAYTTPLHLLTPQHLTSNSDYPPGDSSPERYGGPPPNAFSRWRDPHPSYEQDSFRRPYDNLYDDFAPGAGAWRQPWPQPRTLGDDRYRRPETPRFRRYDDEHQDRENAAHMRSPLQQYDRSHFAGNLVSPREDPERFRKAREYAAELERQISDKKAAEDAERRQRRAAPTFSEERYNDYAERQQYDPGRRQPPGGHESYGSGPFATLPSITGGRRRPGPNANTSKQDYLHDLGKEVSIFEPQLLIDLRAIVTHEVHSLIEEQVRLKKEIAEREKMTRRLEDQKV
ncbi:hypothetical protein HK104_002976 [Borealophlyctis nickersoniae]|nr:hypothetical protein HK104_002976 [Borealophlyctis nickersoniae]